MIRSAALCLLMAAAMLPDLALAQSDWNPTDLEDDIFIGILAGGGALFLIVLCIIAVCCCCFMCPGLFGGLACCGPPQEPEMPYFEPPPQYYPPPPPEPEPYPLVIAQPPPQPEPVYIVKPEPEPRRERVSYIVRDSRERDYDDYDRRVIISRSPSRSLYGSRRQYDYDDRHDHRYGYDDRRYTRPTSSFIRRNDYY